MKRYHGKKQHIAAVLLAGLLILAGCGQDAADGEPLAIQGEPITETAWSAEITAAGTMAVPEEGAEEETDEPAAAQEEAPAADSASAVEEVADEITLLMVGDILLHTPVEAAALQEDGTRDFSVLFAHTKDLIAAPDLALVNQEVILGGESLGISGYPAFNGPFEVGDALVNAGFDVILHATNHALDKGKNGLVNCMDFWDSHYPEIEYLGIHDSAEDQNEIFYHTEGDLTVAILNYTYGTNGISLPADMPWGVDLMDDGHRAQIESALQEADRNADFVIVCPHWGTEYELGISSQQKKWTKIFLENGVDLVIGTHPHVIEPVEWVTDEETGARMLVYYSLGNYVNWTSGTGSGVANRMVGGMAQVTIALDGDKAVISDYGVTALVAHLEDGVNGVTVYPLSEYSAELGEQNRIRSQDSAFSYEYCVDLCDRIWGDLWE